MINNKNIVCDPSDVLRKTALKVELPLSLQDQETLNDMIEYVRNSKNPKLCEELDLSGAVGIAAPQIGISKQMCVVNVDHFDQDGNVTSTDEFALVNPKIIAKSTKLAALKTGEGCLSIKQAHPGLVYRPYKIVVQAFDYLSNKEIEIHATGYLAIVLSHEIDHLKGILFYDHINKNDPYKELPNSLLIE